ncbi:hypothetical protein [Bradyrhizobium sp. USDA 4353]
MKRWAVWAFAFVVAAASPTRAEWGVRTYRDKMTDKTGKYAVLQAKASDRGIAAALEIDCMAGHRPFHLKLSSPLTRGKVSLNMRVDERKVRPIILNVLSDPHQIAFITAPPFDLWGRKRFRVQVFPAGGPVLFYDFDLTGIEKAISGLDCNGAPGETFEDTAD